MGNEPSTAAASAADLSAQLSHLGDRIATLNDARQWRQLVPANAPSDLQLFLFGAHVRCVPGVRVVTGPVIGRVSDTAAVVLLEVSAAARVTCVASAVTAKLPQGRPVARVTVDMPANRPRSFLLTGLVPGQRHVVFFSGVHPADARVRLGHFRTVPRDAQRLRLVAVAGDRPDDVEAGQYNLWEQLHEDVDAGHIDVMLHVGGQANVAPVFHECWLGLRRLEESGMLREGSAQAVAGEEDAAERLRDVYRAAWNMPHTRETLAGCSHLMMWSEDDVGSLAGNLHGMAPREAFSTEPGLLAAPLALKVMLRAAQQVYREYQRQLFDPEGHCIPGLQASVRAAVVVAVLCLSVCVAACPCLCPCSCLCLYLCSPSRPMPPHLRGCP